VRGSSGTRALEETERGDEHFRAGVRMTKERIPEVAQALMQAAGSAIHGIGLSGAAAGSAEKSGELGFFRGVPRRKPGIFWAKLQCEIESHNAVRLSMERFPQG